MKIKTLDVTLQEFLFDLGLCQDVAVIDVRGYYEIGDDPKVVFKDKRHKISEALETSIYKDYKVVGLGTKTNCCYIDKTDKSFDNFLIIYITKR